jgi:hypothetical protein
MEFEGETILKAIQDARDTINQRSKGLRGYDMGYNDCFSFLSEYDKNLRGDSSKIHGLSLSYNSASTFLRNIKKLGYKGLSEMSEAFGYDTLPEHTRPQLGDIIYEIGSEGGTTAVADDFYWINSDGRKANIYRKIRSIELNALLLARPRRII